MKNRPLCLLNCDGGDNCLSPPPAFLTLPLSSHPWVEICALSNFLLKYISQKSWYLLKNYNMGRGSGVPLPVGAFSTSEKWLKHVSWHTCNSSQRAPPHQRKDYLLASWSAGREGPPPPPESPASNSLRLLVWEAYLTNTATALT